MSLWPNYEWKVAASLHLWNRFSFPAYQQFNAHFHSRITTTTRVHMYLIHELIRSWWNLLNGSIIKSHKLIIMNLLLFIVVVLQHKLSTLRNIDQNCFPFILPTKTYRISADQQAAALIWWYVRTGHAHQKLYTVANDVALRRKWEISF